MKSSLLPSLVAGLSAALLPAVAMAQDAPGALSDGLFEAPLSPFAVRRIEEGRPIPVIVTFTDTAMLAAPRSAAPTTFELEQRREVLTSLRERVLLAAMGESGLRRLSDATRAAHAGQSVVEERVTRQFAVTPAFSMMARPDTIQALRNHPDVLSVTEDVPVPPVLDESIPLVGADDAWALGADGSGWAVAILDSGVETEHPMTGPAITASACFNTVDPGSSTSLCPGGLEEETDLTGPDSGDSCVEDDIARAPETGTDGCFHGTHVASTAAGRTVNLSGGRTLNGVARASDIVAVNVFSRFEADECEDSDDPCILSYQSDQLAALEWLYDNRNTLNLAAVNMSLGGGEYSSACTAHTLRNIVVSLHTAGVATVIASGNERFLDAVSSPSCIPEAITVGSTTKNDEISSFSNSSELVDLLAPGSSIMAAWQSEEPPTGENCIIQDDEPNSEGFCHWFAQSSGTSMATPHVAGAFAALRDGFPSATVDEILTALQFTGMQVTDPDNGITRSRIDVGAAYEMLQDGGVLAGGVELTPAEAYRVSGESGDPTSFGTKLYQLENTTGSARSVTVSSTPAWIDTNSGSFSIPAGSSRTLELSVDMGNLPVFADSGRVTLTSNGQTMSIPVSIQVEQTGAVAELGPYPWAGDASAVSQNVFRITGLDTGLPTAISVALSNTAFGAYSGDFSDCSLTVQPGRYNRGEYIITNTDLAECGNFRRADLTFRIFAEQADITEGIRMRRFATNSLGGMTDFSFDAEGTSSSETSAQSGPGLESDAGFVALAEDSIWARADTVPDEPAAAAPAALANADFGPFEWTGDANAFTGSAFRISGLGTAIPTSIFVAIDNAASDGYAGAFSDCALNILGTRYNGSEYLIFGSDLAACGNFVRGDLTFRISADSTDVSNGLAMRRFATALSGGLTDFAFDQESSAFSTFVSLDATHGQAAFGPFEWTGDSSAGLSSIFRIVGFETGLPTQIDLAIRSAQAAGYNGTFADCSLTIRPERKNGQEYLVTQSDLGDCGAFGQADLVFRIRGLKTDVPQGLMMRRFAIGPSRDLTDFGFDHTPGSNATASNVPNGAPSGLGAVSFGPFDWVEDANGTTMSSFRISGLASGAPYRVDVALMNATAGSGIGSYFDCSLTIRAARSGEGDFVILPSDFADCGSFGRADVLFRVVADEDDVNAGLTMRRLVTTSAGGLSDLGFDADSAAD
ncbi:S8 family serine peptidase [Maricaulis sp.]|uniref:S8 family peptidase n=1 Tax=Maricaulis sp. TaxID=1486257 RepID=UPI001B254D48|nr:S8 family serine peptidase [Maricaulis sp.]MBO6764458.1 S8 family serine peptidase [Maricaulis sp.]